MTSRVSVALRVRAAPERAFAVFVEEIGAWRRPGQVLLMRLGEWWQGLLAAYKVRAT